MRNVGLQEQPPLFLDPDKKMHRAASSRVQLVVFRLTDFDEIVVELERFHQDKRTFPPHVEVVFGFKSNLN